mmetsp:Transcript_31234/g.90199  ORF Transcript_31234/g.90199 Transcript_31234/m.90199 type:complete len:221 (-) Transcript_31234:1823-2485(-)
MARRGRLRNARTWRARHFHARPLWYAWHPWHGPSRQSNATTRQHWQSRLCLLLRHRLLHLPKLPLSDNAARRPHASPWFRMRWLLICRQCVGRGNVYVWRGTCANWKGAGRNTIRIPRHHVWDRDCRWLDSGCPRLGLPMGRARIHQARFGPASVQPGCRRALTRLGGLRPVSHAPVLGDKIPVLALDLRNPCRQRTEFRFGLALSLCCLRAKSSNGRHG